MKSTWAMYLIHSHEGPCVSLLLGLVHYGDRFKQIILILDCSQWDIKESLTMDPGYPACAIFKGYWEEDGRKIHNEINMRLSRWRDGCIQV